eukprot:143325-Pleurochrysis_carterae.AAC.1
MLQELLVSSSFSSTVEHRSTPAQLLESAHTHVEDRSARMKRCEMPREPISRLTCISRHFGLQTCLTKTLAHVLRFPCREGDVCERLVREGRVCALACVHPTARASLNVASDAKARVLCVLSAARARASANSHGAA